jgi:2-polyprenyl-6-methoxyphenol hydroxylase-like FAD-dependent oxidoreductase
MIGGGIVGLCTAMMLAKQGQELMVFERDAEPVPNSPEEAWLTWKRLGVAQFRQPHYLHAAARHILDEHLPEVKEAMLRAGCLPFDLTSLMSPFITDRAPRDGDERFVTVTGRRVTMEFAVATTAAKLIQVVRGVSIAGLLTGRPAADGVPHVIGVRTTDRSEVPADLVIDASGRRSTLPTWLEAIGTRPPFEDSSDYGFIYYTRFFRAVGSAVPQFRAGLLTHFDAFSLLTLPGDSDIWQVTVFILSGDPTMKAVRDPERWTSLVSACPRHAHCLTVSQSATYCPWRV